MDIYEDLTENWVHVLNTPDSVEANIEIEEIVHSMYLKNDLDIKKLVVKLFKKIDNSKCIYLIENAVKLAFQFYANYNQDNIKAIDLFKLTRNSLITFITIQVFSADKAQINEIISENILSSNINIFEEVFSLIAKNKCKQFYDQMQEILGKIIQYLSAETEIFNSEFSLSKKMSQRNDCYLDAFIHSQKDFEQKFEGLEEFEEYYSNIRKIMEFEYESFNAQPVGVNFYHRLYIEKRKLVLKLIRKTIIILQQSMLLDTPLLITEIRKNILDLFKSNNFSNPEEDLNFDFHQLAQNKETELNLDDISEEDLMFKFKAFLYYYLGFYGDLSDGEILFNRFKIEENETIKIAVIKSLGALKIDNSIMYQWLNEIASDEKYYFYAVANMVKIGGSKVEDFIFEQMKSTNPRRVLVTSFFIPELENKKFDKISKDLLRYKQPLIVRQGLWVIKKRGLSDAIPEVINLIFSSNKSIKKDAISVLMQFKGDSLPYLQKKLKYYGKEKRELLTEIIEKLEDKVQRRLF